MREYIFSMAWCVFFFFVWLKKLSFEQNPNTKHKKVYEKHYFPEKHIYSLSPKNTKGNIIVSKNFERNWNQPLMKWTPENQTLMYIHIPKTGGKSMRHAISQSKFGKCGGGKKLLRNITHLKEVKLCPGVQSIIYGFHYTWKQIENVQKLGYKTAPLVMLRNPVNRMVSHFYHLQKYNASITKQYHSLKEYLEDKQHHCFDGMLLDGLTASFLIGTLTPITMPWAKVLDIALDNLNKCLWIGIYEFMEESIELLNYQTGMNISMPILNNNTYPKPTPNERNTISTFMSYDLYIYTYAKKLFLHRWNWYLAHVKSKEIKMNITLSTMPEVIEENECHKNRI